VLQGAYLKQRPKLLELLSLVMWLQPLILLLLLKLLLPTAPKLLLTLLPKLPLQTQAALKMRVLQSTMLKIVGKVH
jgi:hypothetical protein